MESTFAKLVDQFTAGKMSRRDLIQSLAAVTAVAATNGQAVAAAAPARREFKALTVNHISYQSKDYAKARDFYSKNLGMEVSHDNGRQCYLRFGQSLLIVRQSQTPATAPLIDHIAYTMADYGRDDMDEATFKVVNDRVKAELEARGMKPEPETNLSWRVRDPDGFPVQLGPALMRPGHPMFEKAIGANAAKPVAK